MTSFITEEAKLVELLCRVPFLGSKSIFRLLEKYPTIEKIQNAIRHNPEKKLHFLSEKGRRGVIELFQEPITFSQNPYLYYQDLLFPKKLLQLYDPPCGMYFKGNVDLLKNPNPWIGIVGTRSATQYALRVCRQLLIAMKPHQPVIVSGMAVGVDGKAHQTAIELGLPTMGILGTSIHQVYPPFYEDLHRQMESHGLLLAELPPGSPIGPWNFPKRNRIIAALSDILIVVEAPEKSGALLTAQFALELGKEIFVVPGPYDSRKNIGGHRLIQQGAHLLIEVEEIFQYFQKAPVCAPSIKNLNLAAKEKKQIKPPLDEEEQKIFDLLKEGAMHVDKIVAMSHLPAPKIMGLLMNLVLKEVLQELPGKIFELLEY